MSEKGIKAYSYAIRLLSVKDYSTYKLKQKLTSKRLKLCEIDEAIAKLISEGYLCEERYIKNRVRGLIRKNNSKHIVWQKLKLEGLEVSTTKIDEIFEENQIVEEDQIKIIIDKKLGGRPSNSSDEEWKIKKNKVLRYLFSKGYSIDKARDIIKGH